MLRRDDLIYPELSFQIIGCAFDVYNELGFGHKEKYYQRALAIAFKAKNLEFKEQVYTPLKFKNQVVGKYYFDFLVADKIIVEIKKDNRYSKHRVDQVKEYLASSKLMLALLINFTNSKVDYMRVVNISP